MISNTIEFVTTNTCFLTKYELTIIIIDLRLLCLEHSYILFVLQISPFMIFSVRLNHLENVLKESQEWYEFKTCSETNTF